MATEPIAKPGLGIPQALDLLIKTGVQLAIIQTLDLHQGEKERTVLVSHNGKLVEKKLPNPPNVRRPNIFTIAGLVQYINEQHGVPVPTRGAVFVSKTAIKYDPHFDSSVPSSPTPTRRDLALLLLDVSPEFGAMNELAKPLVQPALWELLATKLDGNLDHILRQTIQTIKVTAKEDSQVSIEELGAADASSSATLKVSFPSRGADREETLSQQYVWTGRIFQAWDKEYEITLTLFVEWEDKKITFRFVPTKLDDVIIQATDDIVAHLREAITHENCFVYSGLGATTPE